MTATRAIRSASRRTESLTRGIRQRVADAARRPRRFIGPPPARPCQAEPVTGLALKAPPATATHGLASLALSYWRTAAARSPPPPPRQSACQASHVALACHLDCLASPTATALLLAWLVFLSAGLQL